MAKEEGEFLDYPTTKTYSLKIKNVMKIDKLSKKLKIDKSKVLNKIVEEFQENEEDPKEEDLKEEETKETKETKEEEIKEDPKEKKVEENKVDGE